VEFLTKEKSTIANIKDKTVRKNALSGIKSAIYQLRAYKKAKAPKNGLILCSGVVDPHYWV